MPNFAVVTAFRATDKMSPAFNKMSGAADRFGAHATGAMGRARMAMQGLISKAAMFAKMGAGIGVGLIAREFIQFDHAITSASAKFPDLDRNTKAGKKTLEKLRMTARLVGRDTQFSAGQAAKGLDYLAMAGFNAQQSMKLLPGVSDLATVANIDFARATDIASDAIGAFGKMSKDPIKLAKNFRQVQDQMAVTITRTNTDMETLFETIKYGAAPFTAAGQKMSTFNALAGRMAANSIKGSMAGTALRAAIVRLQKPTKDVTKGLAIFGMTQKDIVKDGKLMDMVDILGKLEKNGKKLTSVQRNMALASIFGTRAVSAFGSIMNEGVKHAKNLRDALGSKGTAGAAARMAKIMRGSLLNKLKALWSAVVELGFKFIDAFSKKGAGSVDTLTNVARKLGPVFTFLGKAFSVIAGFLPTIIKGFLIYKGILLATFLIQKAQLALGWISYLWSMIPVMAASIKAQGLFNFLLGGTSTMQTILAIKMRLLAAAQWILNAAMSANPIGIIITLIGGLITVVVLAIKYWDQWGKSLMGFLGPIGKVIIMIKTLYDNWIKIKKEFAKGGFLGGMKSLGQIAVKSFTNQNIVSPNSSNNNSNVRVAGQINVAGAPPGSTAKMNTFGFGDINMSMVGSQ
jgi:TP901 family phage tail tape measure protein